MILKTNLHFHTKEDDYADYNIYQGIDYAKEHGFDALAYTSHKKCLVKEDYTKYASQKDVLLIPGIEMKIKRKEIVVLNCGKEIENVRSFQELRNYKNKNPHIFIIAPHSFVFSLKSLRSKLMKNIDLFDAIEMTVFSNNLFNFNRKAVEIAEKYNKPFIANSDTHFLNDLERGYALIDVKEKTIESIFEAIKMKNFQNKMNSMNPLAMLEFRIKIGLNIILNLNICH